MTTDLWSMGSAAENDLLGKAVIVHAKSDDFTTQPSGAAGDRIACGRDPRVAPRRGSF